MRHYLITRFNLKVEHWVTSKDNLPVRTNDWLDHRFELFEKYCLPSVIHQSNQNFIWLIYFDIDTPIQYRSKIEGLSNKHSNLEPQFIEGIHPLNTAIKQYIIDDLDGESDFIITTRLDNDDAIHQNFVETIQSLAKPHSGTVIDLRRGYQLDITKNVIEIRNYVKSFNPFISLVECSTSFNTVFHMQHQEWKQSEVIVIEDKTPLWIEVVHQKNKMNSTRIYLPLIKELNFAEFGITDNFKNYGLLYIIINNTKLYLNKILRRLFG